MKTTLKKENSLNNEHNLKNKDDLKKWRQKLYLPSKKFTWIFFMMTSYVDSHGSTDIKPELLSGAQIRKFNSTWWI